MQNSQTGYRVCAEMNDQTGIATGIVRWLGLDPMPCWTEESKAIEFDSKHELTKFLRNGNFYPAGLLQPKLNTVQMVKRTVHTRITLRISRLH